MKKSYEISYKGIRYTEKPIQWDKDAQRNLWLSKENLFFCETWNKDFVYVMQEDYICYEYKRDVNIFSFGKFTLKLPFTLIALPASIDGVGYVGNLGALIRDYSLRKGLFLILNIPKEEEIPEGVPYGETLPTCNFDNAFDSFEDYLKALRSPYRRRIKLALLKMSGLKVRKIQNSDFNSTLYGYYIEVLNRSSYPLETLPIAFFQESKDEIYAFYEQEKAIAFVMVKRIESSLYFLFGGMNYEKRDTYDLYYNMLLFILQTGIKGKAKRIHFGQTAESSKERLGCHREERYMCVFTKNKGLNMIIRKIMIALEFKQKDKKYRVYHSRQQEKSE